MNKCPTCGNMDVKKFHVIGLIPEKGAKLCNKCVSVEKYRKIAINKAIKISGAKKNG